MKSKKKKAIPAVFNTEDKREKKKNPGAEFVAMWCVRSAHADKLKDGANFYSPDDSNMAVALLKKGNSKFYSEVSDALSRLEYLNPRIIDGCLAFDYHATAKDVIARCWYKWEKRNDKIVVRLAELKEKIGREISQPRYYALLKQMGLR